MNKAFMTALKSAVCVCLCVACVFAVNIRVYADCGVTPQKYKGGKAKTESAKTAVSSTEKEEKKTDKTPETKPEEKTEAKAEVKKKVSSNTGLVAYVNRTQNVVKVVCINDDGSESVLRTMVCSVGRAGHSTPLGTFKTTNYYDWRLMVDNTFGRYAVRFNGHIMFHSVPYLKQQKDTLEWDQYNLLGQPASLGCVRLAVADAKWIYDNCPKGTTVVVYDDPSEALVKPAGRIILESSPNKGWDPTDPDVENPWND